MYRCNFSLKPFSKTLIILGLIIAVMFTAIACQEAPRSGSLTLKPAIAAPAEWIQCYGAAFVPGEKVKVTMEIDGVPIEFKGAEGETLAGVQADASGLFVLKVRVPKMTKDGAAYYMTAKGTDTTARAVLTVYK